MSLSRFEREIIFTLHSVIGKRIREKDLLEWRTGEIKEQTGEQVVHLPTLGVWVAIPDTIKIQNPRKG